MPKKKYSVVLKVRGYYEVEVEADNMASVKDIAVDKFLEEDFGELKETECKLCAVYPD